MAAGLLLIKAAQQSNLLSTASFRSQVSRGSKRLGLLGFSYKCAPALEKSRVLQNLVFAFQFGLQTAQGQLEQLVLPFAINNLVLQEVLVLLEGVGPSAEVGNFFLQVAFVGLLLGLVVCQLLHGHELLLNLSVLSGGILILVVEFCDELAQLTLLLLYVDRVALEVVVLVLLQNPVQLHI